MSNAFPLTLGIACPPMALHALDHHMPYALEFATWDKSNDGIASHGPSHVICIGNVLHGMISPMMALHAMGHDMSYALEVCYMGWPQLRGPRQKVIVHDRVLQFETSKWQSSLMWALVAVWLLLAQRHLSALSGSCFALQDGQKAWRRVQETDCSSQRA